MSQTDIHQEQEGEARFIVVVGAGVTDAALLRNLHSALSNHGVSVVVVDELPLLSERDRGRHALGRPSQFLQTRFSSTQAPYDWYRRFERGRRDSHRF